MMRRLPSGPAVCFISPKAAAAILLLALFLGGLFPEAGRAASMQQEAYRRLDGIRETRKRQLLEYLDRIKARAYEAGGDGALLDFFHIKSRYYHLQKTAPPPAHLVAEIETLKSNIREHCLRRYLLFHDILFIDKNGDIFFTVRQQEDYHKNIFHGELAETALSQKLKANTRQSFVDYQYYWVSDKPSAFFIQPVHRGQDFSGWIVLQFTIQRINRMFIQERELGATGEVFLVNRQCAMLTDSRFCPESSILRKHLSAENIAAKFREGAGHKIVTDYRGFRALSAFEVCRIDDIEWLLIAKIDEDEIVTEAYRNGSDRLREPLMKRFETQPACDVPLPAAAGGRLVEVDMDEFRKAGDGQVLYTHGVSTCTAVVIGLPGKFAYLAHISNLDRIYGGQHTDLIGQMLKRIYTFDVYPSQRRYLQATVAANHLESAIAAIDRLVDEGFLLAQIKFVYEPQAEYANLAHDPRNGGQTVVEWLMDRRKQAWRRQCAENAESVGQQVKALIDSGQ